MRPASIRLPASLGLKRKTRAPPPHIAPERLAQWRPKHDDYTMIYDVFHSPKDGGLIAIGPDPSSFGDDRLRLRSVRVNDETRDAKIETLHPMFAPPRLVKIRIAAPAAAQYRVEFDWGAFSAGVDVASRDGEREDNRFTLQTLQKDNAPEWIVDWCRFYHRVHGVERVLLYDNGSANRDEVVRALRDLDEAMDIVVIDWPFPYGAHDRDLYCQLGALNHCGPRFAGPHSVFLATDVDCYIHAERYALKDVLPHFSRRPIRQLLWAFKQRRHRRTLRPESRGRPAPLPARPAPAPTPSPSAKPQSRKRALFTVRLSNRFKPASGLLIRGFYGVVNRLPDDFGDRTPRCGDFVWRKADKTLTLGHNLYMPARTAYIQIHITSPKRGYARLTDDSLYFPRYEYTGLRTSWKGVGRFKVPEGVELVRDTTIPDAMRRPGRPE